MISIHKIEKYLHINYYRELEELILISTTVISSPNNSLYRNNNVIAGTTLRPNPPPYKPKNIHYNGTKHI